MDPPALVSSLADIEAADVRLRLLYEVATPSRAREIAELLKKEADRARYQDPALSIRWCADIVALGKVMDAPTVVALGRMGEASTMREQGQYRESLEIFDEAATLFREYGDEVGWARAQIGRLGSCMVLGRFEEALERGQEARATLEEAGEHLHVASVEGNLANILEKMNRPAEALAYNERALNAYRAAGATYYATHALGNHALFLWRLGRVREAIAAHREAREAYANLGAPGDAAREDLNIGLAHLSLGHYADAMSCFAAARRDLRDTALPYLAAWAGLSLTECLVRTGRWREAIESAETLHEEFAAYEDPILSSQALAWQAQAQAGLYEYDAALHTLERAGQALTTSDSLVIHRTILDVSAAQLLLETHRAAQARDLLREAIATLRLAGLTVDMAAAQVLLGRALLEEGQLAEAHDAAADVLTVAEREGMHWLSARAHHLHGHIADRQKNGIAARQSFAAAVRSLDYVHRRVAWDDCATFIDTTISMYADAVALALRQHRVAAALRYAERSKARALADHLRVGIDVRPRPRDERSRALIEELTALRERYAWLGIHVDGEPAAAVAVRSLGPTGQRAGGQAEARPIERRMAEIWRELQASNPVYRGEAAALDLVATEDDEIGDDDEAADRWVQQLQRALNQDDRVLLEYVALDDDLVLFVVRDGSIQAVRLNGAVTRLHRLVPLLRLNVERAAAMASGGAMSRKALSVNAIGILKRMYEVLLAPAAPLIEGASHLIVVPHGVSHHIPFHALHTGTRHLIEGLDVVYAPCASLIEHFAERDQMLRESRRGSEHQALAVACSNHGALQHVGTEARSVVDAFDGQLLCEEDATLDALRSTAGNCSVLHLAAHALFRPDEPLFSALQLWDGKLSTLDVFDLELSCSLTTLSACETALGVAGAGDELMGLSRAFLYAGSPSLVLSLWKVDDSSTATLMRIFYAALCRGASRAAALREAQLALLHNDVDSDGDFSAPFYWAPFQLMGHPGPL